VHDVVLLTILNGGIRLGMVLGTRRT
jgi:hypothetical protein